MMQSIEGESVSVWIEMPLDMDIIYMHKETLYLMSALFQKMQL